MKKQYHFIHLTFQEYFAARHLLNLLKGSTSQQQAAVNFINKYKYNARFHLLFVFASGLTSQSPYQLSIEPFWNTINSEPLDLIGLHHAKLIIECTNEIIDTTVNPKYTTNIIQIAYWLQMCMHTESQERTECLLQYFQRAKSIPNQTIIQNTLIQLLSVDNLDEKKRAFRILSLLNISEPIPELLRLLGCAISQQDSAIRDATYKTLEKIGQKAATKEIITALINELRLHGTDRRHGVWSAITKIVAKTTSLDVIDILINALNDTSSNIRQYACRILCNIEKLPVKKELIDAVLNTIHDHENSVRAAACSTLGHIGRQSMYEEVIDALINAVRDRDNHVHNEALKALGHIGEQSPTKQIIDVLIDAPDRSRSHIFGNVFLSGPFLSRYYQDVSLSALVTIGKKTSTNGVIESLINTLFDLNSYSRIKACTALAEISKEVVTQELLNALINVLGDPKIGRAHV